MATQPLTQELVNATAKRLWAENGKLPSNRDVLSCLGSGSMTTISKFMSNWRSEAADLGANSRPLPAQLLQELEQLQRDAETSVREAGAAALENARETEQHLVQENDQLLAEVATLQAQLQAARETATTAQAQLAQLQTDHVALKAELCSERSCVAELRIELTKASLRLDETLPRLLQELAECREHLTISHQARTDAELKAAVAQERASGLEQRLAALQPSHIS